MKTRNRNCYISEMAHERKSPQEKKLREYSDRVTAGNRRHAEARKKEKKNVGSETRSKRDELLAQIKPQISSEDAEIIAGEFTAAHVQKSASRKQPRKSGAEPFSRVIEWQLERRRESFGRKTKKHPYYDQLAREAIGTLSTLDNEQMIVVSRRAGLLCTPENRHKYVSKQDLNHPVDHALDFVRRAISRWSQESQALCRNKDLDMAFTTWVERANRILRKDRLAAQRKLEEQQIIKKKLKTPEN